MRLWLHIILVFASVLCGQPQEQPQQEPAKPVIRYSGEPVPVPFSCGGDDLQMFPTPCPAQSPCPVYLQLTAVEAQAGKLFLGGNFHNDSTTMYSVLLASEDGGQNWSEAHERIRGAGLDLIHFHDAKTGWASGQVLTLPPRAPFFLLTTDGGSHWRKRDVFDDERISVIEGFWFENDRMGGLLIDRIRSSEGGGRYERYETMTGGADWMIREVSPAPIRPRNVTPVGPPTDWRVTEDGRTRSWQLQQRQGEKWMKVAAFQVAAGACAAEEVKAPEPPPEEAPEKPPQELPTAPGGVFRIPKRGQTEQPAPAPKKPQS